uniref:Uncharacterized protein n=1 Tax=viral metagenome TaxID=1070528 RepID=A0A6C0IVP0_9ZZZZ
MNKAIMILSISIGLLIILSYIFEIKFRHIKLGMDVNGYKRGKIGVENFNSRPAKLDYKVSDNDGLKLTNCPEDRWRHPPSNENLVVNSFTPQGHGVSLKENSYITNIPESGPGVDSSGTTKSMFTFAYNQCKPECCPSTYSCDGGCVCTTESQRDFLAKRGLNKTSSDYNEF